MEMETAKAGLEHVACPPLQFGKFYVSIWDSKPWEQFTSSKLSKLSSLDQSAIQNHEGMDTTVVCEVGLVLKQESHPKQKIAFQAEMGCLLVVLVLLKRCSSETTKRAQPPAHFGRKGSQL